MLDRLTSRSGRGPRAAALTIEGRAVVDGAYRNAVADKTFARISPINGRPSHAVEKSTDTKTVGTAWS